MYGHKSNQPVSRIQQLRRRKLQRLVAIVMAKQPQIPAFIESMTSISKKKKLVSVLLFTLLMINLAVCAYQTSARVLFFMNEPTTVDAHLIETTFGSYPYVYIYPITTQEYNDNNGWSQCNVLWGLPNGKHHELSDAIKDLSSLSYITEAYFEMGKSRINLTIENYDSVMQPTAQISSSMQLPYGDVNYKMVIKLEFPYGCNEYYGLIDPSPIKYHFHFDDGLYMSLRTGSTKNKYLATSNFQEYHFINTKRNPCDNNLHDCFRLCLLKEINCRYSFYEARYLPKCNETFLREQYKLWTKFIRNTDVIEYCKCLDLCDVTQQRITYDQIPSPKPAVEVDVVNRNVRTLRQRYCYDIISLLCDIGGNIGLYFGMSCLTLVELFIYCCKMPFIKMTKRRKSKSKLKVKIQTILGRKQERHIQPLLTNKLKTTLLITLIILSVYNVYNSINSYLDYPFVKTVVLVRDENISFPLIVDCRENDNIIFAKMQLARKLDTDYLNYQLVDLLHPSSGFANNSLKLWEDSSNFNGEYRHHHDWQKYNKNRRVLKFANVSELSTVFGICTEFRKADLPYTPSQNTITFLSKYSKTADVQQPNFILPQNQFFHPKHILYIHRRSKVQIDLSRQTLIRIDTPKCPCQADNLVSECEQKCYANKLHQQPLGCRLPFMEKSKLPLCATQETAKQTMKMYLETEFEVDPQKDCSCSIRCEETIFLPSVIYEDIPRDNEIKYSIESNIREEIEQQTTITIVKLLCQIGSIFAILTGLSLFELVEYFI